LNTDRRMLYRLFQTDIPELVSDALEDSTPLVFYAFLYF
jgi:hypothetical protein